MRFWLLGLNLFGSVYLFAQSFTFSTYGVEEGLIQSQTMAICEDHRGYLWVGTLGGLDAYNGSVFNHYSQNNGLFSNRITALYSSGSNLWVGHEGGVSCRSNGQFKTWSLPKAFSSSSVTDLVTFKQKLIVACNGGGLYQLENNALKPIPLKNEDQARIRHILVHQNKIYLATRDGLLVSDDLKTFRKIASETPLNLTDVVVRNELLILTDVDGKVITYHPDHGQIEIKATINQEAFISDALVDSKNRIWLTNENGLAIVDEGWNIQIIDERNGLPLNSTSCLYEDRNKTLWVGSEGRGVFRFAGTHMLRYHRAGGFPSDLVTSVSELQNGSLVLGTYDKGIVFGQQGRFSDLRLTEHFIWALMEDRQGVLWAGTDFGLYALKGRTSKEMMSHVKATCFFRENDEAILCGGSFGLVRIKNGLITSVAPAEPMAGVVRQITVFQNKIVCACDGGLFSLSGSRLSPFLGFNQSCNSVYSPDGKVLWIGSESGLYRTAGQSPERINLTDPAINNVINFMISCRNRLMVGTNNGLYELSEQSDKYKFSIRYFGIEEGLINLETNYNSAFIDRNDHLWFGTSKGLMRIDLNAPEMQIPDLAPQLQIARIRINFQTLDYKKFSDRFSPEGIPLELYLPPSKNNLILELDGIALKHHKYLRYEYWLEGEDEHWSPPLNSPFLTLNNLPSGDYRLHVRAVNQAGQRSNTFVIDLHIQPYFYKTWWFFLLNAMLLALIIYGVFKYRINREREKQYKESLEFKTKLMLLEQQSLNASMNRHFIFNSLNSIQYFINTQDRHSANKYLTNFAKLIRKNLDSSSENNNMISLQQEIERLELYLSLESMRFKDRFDYKIDTNDVDLESIMVPSMLFQPFIENSIIHGVLPLTDRKGLIQIRLWVENSVLHVLIEDNGIGIENSLSKKANFDGDHQSKGMEITTKRIDLLAQLSQQNYEMEGPFQVENSDRSLNGTRVLIKIPVENLED